VSATAATEDLLRELAPQVLDVLVRRYGQFEECEDAVQEEEAAAAAVTGWLADGVPATPAAG
jgi:predicted RNA polymerase sigma factor